MKFKFKSQGQTKSDKKGQTKQSKLESETFQIVRIKQLSEY